MPGIETNGRHQDAVYWAATSSKTRYGKLKVSAAAAIVVRWEDVYREAIDANGNPIQIVAELVVPIEIPLGTIFWQGLLADVPSPPVDLFKVVGRETVPDLKARETMRTVMLAKFSDTLPEIDAGT